MRTNTRSAVFSAGVIAAALLYAAPALAIARPDPWITTKAKIALLTDSEVSGTKINVDTVDGVVSLYGNVASDKEKAEAERAVRGIEGVKEVRNMLQVKAPQGTKETTSAKADDATIEKRVNDAIDKDPALSDSHIKVASVKDGVVTLEGDARTMSDHRRALEKARSVDGVKQVRSDVKAPEDLRNEEVWSDTGKSAQGTAHTASDKTKGAASGVSSAAKDMWITTDTKVRLIADDKTPANDINVDTTDGQVTLFGMVPSEDAKRAAEAEARKVSGVVSVRNELQVVPKKSEEKVEAKDDDVKKAVNDKIDARPELRNDDVDVEVSNGVVRLTGEVDSQADRLSALTTARSVPGVRSTIDQLKVKSSDASASTERERADKQDRMEENRDTDAYDGSPQHDAGEAPLH